jgi:hypothetical protein
MRSIITLLFILTFTMDVSAQDLIRYKSSDVTNTQTVKIIYVDDTCLYYYNSNDLAKAIQFVKLDDISEFQYNSIENGRNINTIKNDSLLYVSYAKKNKIALPSQLKWDRPYSVDLIATLKGEKFKVKIISKDNEYVRFKIFDENDNLSDKILKHPTALISNTYNNTSYFYGKSFFDNNIILIEKANLSNTPKDYYTYYDYIKPFGKTELRVKIVNVDDEFITYFLPTDLKMSIKQVYREDIKSYNYSSIENYRNTEVIKKDRELYSNFLESKLNIGDPQPVNNYEKARFAPVNTNTATNIIGLNNSSSEEFNKAGNNLAYAGVLILGGGLLHLIAGRDDLATISELNSRVTMAKIGTYMYCGAGIFVIRASVNIRNGAINLK